MSCVAVARYSARYARGRRQLQETYGKTPLIAAVVINLPRPLGGNVLGAFGRVAACVEALYPFERFSPQPVGTLGVLGGYRRQ